jgi:AraC-like DNA-binding protein
MENWSVAPLAPKIFRFADIDEFRSSVRHLSLEFTPLVHKISAEQIILNLPGCDVNFTTSFPRIVDVQLGPDCTAVGFSMDDGVPIRFNGVERDQSIIVIGRGGAVYSAVETVRRQYASIVFRPEVVDRGWPPSGASFSVYETSPSAHRALRRLVLQVLAVASEFSDEAATGGIAAAMQESLFAAIDMAFADVVMTRWAAHANSSPKLKIFRDVEAGIAGRYDSPIYSKDLAREVGVSVRTMHDVILRYRGMSLHRYLRLRRLWLVRRRLLAGTHSVKAAALAFGFWHLSDFSHNYLLQFGESPSATLARSRAAGSSPTQ